MATIASSESNLNFIVQTCEAAAASAERIPFCPPVDTPPFAPFEAGDPFGLRKAVLPIFERTPAGALVGMGTAVHVDGWGGLLTAEHVIDFLRAGLDQRWLAEDTIQELDPICHSHAIVMLGMGLVFGQVAAPAWVFAPIVETLAVTAERDDPLAALRGGAQREVIFDVAGLQAAIPADAYQGQRSPPQTLPVQLTGWAPTVGETVLAFGYPELEPSSTVSDATLQALIRDGLFAAYGTITRLFPHGRDAMNRTPMFEVEADWPAGMSGGPVVNEAGAVVGIVSRSLAPDGDAPGVGYAACLPWLAAHLSRLAPRLDPDNPGFRMGYGAHVDGELRGFWPTRELALQHVSRHGLEAHIAACSQRIGTDQYFRFT